MFVAGQLLSNEVKTKDKSMNDNKKPQRNFNLKTKIFMCVFIFISWQAPAMAYQLNWQDLWHHIQQNTRKWDRVIIKTTVQVFDPFGLVENSSDQPLALTDLGYRQTIYWEEGMLVVESSSHEGELLHFYYQSKGAIVDANTQSKRHFLKMDILPHYLRFVVEHEEGWQKALQEIYIEGNEISFYRDPDFNIHFRIGELQSNHFAVVDKQHFFLKSLHYQIQNGEKEHTIRIVFEKMRSYEKLEYPAQSDYLLDDRLFKRVLVQSFERPERLPWEELSQKAEQWSQTRFTTLNYDYTR